MRFKIWAFLLRWTRRNHHISAPFERLMGNDLWPYEKRSRWRGLANAALFVVFQRYAMLQRYNVFIDPLLNYNIVLHIKLYNHFYFLDTLLGFWRRLKCVDWEHIAVFMRWWCTAPPVYTNAISPGFHLTPIFSVRKLSRSVCSDSGRENIYVARNGQLKPGSLSVGTAATASLEFNHTRYSGMNGGGGRTGKQAELVSLRRTCSTQGRK